MRPTPTLTPVTAEVVAVRPVGAYHQVSLSLPGPVAPSVGTPAPVTPRAGQMLVHQHRRGGVVLPDTWWVAGADLDPVHGATVEVVVERPPAPPGSGLRVLGPLGRGFVAPRPAVPVLVVAHELGQAPALWWARELAERGCPTHLVLVAAHPGRHVDLVRARRGAASVLLCEPGALGEVLARAVTSSDAAVLYAVGPRGVCRVVARVAESAGVVSQVTAFDAATAGGCGTGLCGACEMPASGLPRRRIRPCADGPVLRGDLLDWGLAEEPDR